MSDSQTTSGAPTPPTGRSLSFEVPLPPPTDAAKDSEYKPQASYLRLGATDLNSPAEQAFFKGADQTQVPAGILMISPGKITQYAANLDSAITASDTVRIVAGEDGSITSATYNYYDPSGGVEREVAFKRSLSCELSFSESQSYEYAQSFGAKIANSIEIGATTGFNANIGAAVDMKVGLLSVEMGSGGIEAQSPLGSYSAEQEQSLDGTESVTLRVNPAAEPLRVQMARLAARTKALTALLSTYLAGCITMTGAVSFREEALAPDGGGAGEGPGGNAAAVKLDRAKAALRGIREQQAVFLGLMVIAEAATMALGLVAIALGKKLPTDQFLTRLELATTGATLGAGLTSIDLKRTGTIDLKTVSQIKLATLDTTFIQIGTSEINLVAGSSRIKLGPRGVEISGPAVKINGARVNLAAPQIQNAAQ